MVTPVIIKKFPKVSAGLSEAGAIEAGSEAAAIGEEVGVVARELGAAEMPRTTLKPNIQLFAHKEPGAAPSVEVPKAPGPKPKPQSLDATNKAPYNPRAMEEMLSKDGQEVSSRTLPKRSQPNVRLAGKSIERSVMINSETRETITQRVVFDQRGFPIFDPYVKVETKISGDLNLMSRDAHMRAATRQLRSDIEAGIIDKNIFDQYQLEDIMSGDKKIRGFTWHHHQDIGRMQLVPTNIHKWVKHVGGFDLWGKK